MNPRRLIVLSVLAAATFGAIGCEPPEQAELEAIYAENQTLRTQKQELQEQIAQVTQEYEDLLARASTHDDLVAAKDAEIGLKRREAGVMRNMLVRYHCVVRRGTFYDKSNGFNVFLRRVVKRKEEGDG